jgi:DNA-binding transcriptional ArsR family regulator
MNDELARLHGRLAVLAARKRFELMRLVLAGPARSVTALAAAVGLSQSCTTRHLQALERAGLVQGLRDGRRVVFRPAATDAATAAVVEALGRGEAGPAPRSRRRPARPARPAPVPDPAPVAVMATPVWSPVAEDRPVYSDLAPEAPGEPDAHAAPLSGPEVETAPEPEPSPRPRRQELEDFLL